ncbi:ATP-binding cassette domain-containing protein [Streptomyces spectabilis]|uniref:ATP-binding cassette subfamily B protein n=1 Tax=Streptomyces spectabilis TaxID=68270 RepID=A0A7W8AMR7_STRST|nr:ABC transporter ATP-binding protein [Streptomyces spectabilis]MBB5101192.1 ATP-binding cassette subfamily B protein [Streptomyces spectabilis]MCI3900394.1 ABC transporter ATP-binding protein/permease [Streptomyces spectabilis]GGV09930.1 ABC transporter [Streptomyces spectabilis]
MTTSDSTNTSATTPPPPPPPADLRFEAKDVANRLAGITVRTVVRRLPAAVWWTLKMAWRVDRPAVLLLGVCQLAAGVAQAVALAATARAMGPLLGGADAASRIDAALPALAVMVAAAAVARVFTVLAAYGSGRVTPKLTTEADTRFVETVCRAELTAMEEPGFHDAQTAAKAGVQRTANVVTDVQRCMSALMQITGAMGALTVLHPVLLPLIVLAVVPAGVGEIVAARISYRTHYLNIGDQNVRHMVRWWATTPKHATEVRANGMTDYVRYWYAAISRRMDARTIAAAPRTARTVLAASAVGGLFQTLTWGVLAYLATHGHIGLAVAATAVVGLRAVIASLGNAVSYAANVLNTGMYLEDLHSFLDRTGRAAQQRGTRLPDAPREVRVDNASYTYPSKDRPAVDGLSLTLTRGEVVAVVGVNGAGKSTLMNLITAVTLPDKGRVLWDAAETRALDADAVWRHTGVVTQDFAKWPLRARENVTQGQPRTDHDDPVWEAVDQVGLREAVDELPHGLDTLLAREYFGGSELSGGQWQRFACARALYRKPAVLILDEPTSQLDARGEHQIFTALRQQRRDRITVIVTHRLDNTRLADRILVLDHGRIVEQGTFDELRATPGSLFAELYDLSQDR